MKLNKEWTSPLRIPRGFHSLGVAFSTNHSDLGYVYDFPKHIYTELMCSYNKQCVGLTAKQDGKTLG